MRDSADLLSPQRTTRGAIAARWLDARRVDHDVVSGGWSRLVYPGARPEGTVDRAAYTVCLLEQFHRYLKYRNIFAEHSSKWRAPRTHLLSGTAWEEARAGGMNALGLPEHPRELLADLGADLDAAYRGPAGRLGEDTPATVDADGKLHVAALEAGRRRWRPRTRCYGPLDRAARGRIDLRGEVTRGYRDGMENLLDALGLILNIVVLWNSVYSDRALTALREQGYPVRGEDAARLSAFIRKHIRLEGHYSFNLPDLGGTHRPLRDPDAPEEADRPGSSVRIRIQARTAPSSWARSLIDAAVAERMTRWIWCGSRRCSAAETVSSNAIAAACVSPAVARCFPGSSRSR